MYWLDNDSGVTTPPVIPPVVSATRKYFTEGGGGTQPSIPGGEWFNMITDELLAVLTAAGITPDKANHTQLLAALSSMFPNKSQFVAAIANSGYQKLSSGLIIQWINTTTTTGGRATGSWPIAFPNAFRCIVVNGGVGSSVASQVSAATGGNGTNATTYDVWVANGNAGSGVSIIAIGN